MKGSVAISAAPLSARSEACVGSAVFPRRVDLAVAPRHLAGRPLAIRMLLKDRPVTAAAVIALALGIGVDNSVFTIVDTALSPRLAFEDAHRFVRIRVFDARVPDRPVVSRGHRVTRGSDFGRRPERRHRHDDECQRRGASAERLRGVYIASNGFRLLRVRPIVRHDFRPEVEQAGTPPNASRLRHVAGPLRR